MYTSHQKYLSAITFLTSAGNYYLIWTTKEAPPCYNHRTITAQSDCSEALQMYWSKAQFVTLWFAVLASAVAAFGPIRSVPCRLVQHRRRRRNGASSLSMGMKINIRIVGRKSGSEKWLEEACAMYETRLRPSNVEVESTWHKDNQGLTKGVETDKSKGHTVVLLDPLGDIKTSETFSDDVYEWLDRGGSRLCFVIGGAEGLPSELKYPPQGGKPAMISLSKMTFTHQFARLLLIEQIYRATEIRKGSGYHK
jgi:23S rRNA (pseudouridine1915-N3)-methyltransferase